jgi:glycosyltransferase involved in cell wall biosynthesis
MKILHVVPTYVPAWIYGGPILSVHNLCVEQVKSGHDVTVYTTNVNGKNIFKFKDKSEHNCIVNGVKVYYFSCNISRIYFSISMFFKLCKNLKNFDIVHLHSIFLWPTTCAAILCRKFQVPYIITQRGMLIKRLIKKNFIIKKIWIFFFEKKNIENAKAIQVSTDYEYKEIKKLHYNLRKIFIIPNGVINPRYFRYPKEKKIFLKKKFKNILYIGRVNWKKNIDIIIKAMINLDNFFLTIVGILTAFLSGALVYTIKSKCSKCSLCFGLINIERKNISFCSLRLIIFLVYLYITKIVILYKKLQLQFNI